MLKWLNFHGNREKEKNIILHRLILTMLLCDYWDGFPSDFALKEAGMAFKTKKECEIAIPELRKKYLGIES